MSNPYDSASLGVQQREVMRQQAQLMALLQNSLGQKMAGQFGAMFGTAGGAEWAQKAGLQQEDLSRLARLGGMAGAAMIASPALTFDAMRHSVGVGGSRMRGISTGGAAIPVGSGMESWIGSQLYGQVESQLGAGMGGFSTKRIATELMPSMSARGLMAGQTFDMRHNRAGQEVELEKGSGDQMMSKIGAATETLGAAREIFGDRHMADLAKQAEMLTGMSFDASSVTQIRSMGKKIREMADMAEAFGISGGEMAEAAQRMRSGMGARLQSAGLSSHDAGRAAALMTPHVLQQAVGARMTSQAVMATVQNAGEMLAPTDQELQVGVMDRQARALAAPGGRQFLALQNLQLRNPNLTDSQKRQIQHHIDNFGSSTDKDAWAGQVEGFLSGALGTSSAEVAEHFGMGDLSADQMDEFQSKFVNSSGVDQDTYKRLMQKGKSVGALSSGQMNAQFLKLTSTFFGSFGAESQDDILKAAKQGGGALRDLMSKQGLTEMLPDGMGLNEFASMLTGENQRSLSALRTVGADDTDLLAIQSRERARDTRQRMEQRQSERVEQGKLGTPTDMAGNALMGLLGVGAEQDPMVRREMMLRDPEMRDKVGVYGINDEGGLNIEASGLADLKKKSGVDLEKVFGVKGEAALVKALKGEGGALKLGEAIQQEGGDTMAVSGLDLALTKTKGVTRGAKGELVGVTDQNLDELLQNVGLNADVLGLSDANKRKNFVGALGNSSQGKTGGMGIGLLTQQLENNNPEMLEDKSLAVYGKKANEFASAQYAAQALSGLTEQILQDPSGQSRNGANPTGPNVLTDSSDSTLMNHNNQLAGGNQGNVVRVVVENLSALADIISRLLSPL